MCNNPELETKIENLERELQHCDDDYYDLNQDKEKLEGELEERTEFYLDTLHSIKEAAGGYNIEDYESLLDWIYGVADEATQKDWI